MKFVKLTATVINNNAIPFPYEEYIIPHSSISLDSLESILLKSNSTIRLGLK